MDHGLGFRDRDTGFHSNDIESENARIKNFLRRRYGKLELATDELDATEYMFKVNYDKTWSTYMAGIAQGQGGAYAEQKV